MLRYVEHKLPADVRPRTRFEYVVTGRGEFPTDMLRYDACWPLSSSDVAKIDYGRSTSREARSILIASYSKPTLERWSSFGWSVGTEDLYPAKIPSWTKIR